MRFANFSDGYWTAEGRNFAVPPNALLTAQNIDYLLSGGVIGRRGILKLNSSALGGGQSGRALWRHYPRTGDAKTLAAVDDGSGTDFYHATGTSGTFSAVTGGSNLSDTDDWGFANWPAKNKTFIVNGLGTLREYDGSSIASVSASGTNEVNLAKLGPYITIHKNRLFSTHIDELTHSVYGSEINDETTWLSASQISVNDPQGGTIKGLASFFDFLIILKSTSLFRFVGDISTTLGAQLALYSDRGCIAPDSIATTPYGIIFVGRDGVYLTDGVNPNPQELSTPIRSLFVGRTSSNQYTTAVGKWYPRNRYGNGQYVLKLDPTDSDGYVLTRIEVLSENPFIGERSRAVWIWAYHSNLPMLEATVWDSEADDGRLIMLDNAGFVRTFDTGSDDDGSTYTCEIQTAERALDKAGRTGRAYRVKCLHRGSVALSGGIRYDQATSDDVSFTIGSVSTAAEKYPRTSIFDSAELGRFLSIRLSNNTDGPDFEAHVIDVDVRLRSQRVWRDENLGNEAAVLADQGNVVISNTDTEAVVTFGTAQANTNYEIAFGITPSSTSVGPTTVGIKPGTKATTGFTVEVGGAPGTGNSFTISWILARAA